MLSAKFRFQKKETINPMLLKTTISKKCALRFVHDCGICILTIPQTNWYTSVSVIYQILLHLMAHCIKSLGRLSPFATLHES